MTQDIDERTPKQKILDSINTPLFKALNDEGITPSYLAKLLKKELKAKEKKIVSFQGKVTEVVEVEALDIQQKARQDAHRLLDHYPSEKHKVEGTIEVEVVNFSPKKPE